MINKDIARTFEFKSKSNPSAEAYRTILYKDGTTSCNCPGWTRRNMNGVRECKHTLLIDQQVQGGIITLDGSAVAPLSSGPMKAEKVKPVRRRFDLD